MSQQIIYWGVGCGLSQRKLLAWKHGGECSECVMNLNVQSVTCSMGDESREGSCKVSIMSSLSMM